MKHPAYVTCVAGFHQALNLFWRVYFYCYVFTCRCIESLCLL